jgi:hypothetical protein
MATDAKQLLCTHLVIEHDLQQTSRMYSRGLAQGVYMRYMHRCVSVCALACQGQGLRVDTRESLCTDQAAYARHRLPWSLSECCKVMRSAAR